MPIPMDFIEVIDPASLGIHFFYEDVATFDLHQNLVVVWIKKVLVQEEKKLRSIRFIYCSDDYLHQVNIDYLQHDTLTDVITFSYSDKVIDGEIFISTDRVEENADIYGVPFLHELMRVMVHGVLHLCGYDDEEVESKKMMRDKEDFYLEKLSLSSM